MEIERSVSLMQSVVEAGRYVRDVKVVPIKVRMMSAVPEVDDVIVNCDLSQFPLPEVVVIHRDPGCRDDLKQLESYILEV